MPDFTLINFTLIAIGIILLVLEIASAGTTMLDLLLAGLSLCTGGALGYIFASWWLGPLVALTLIVVYWLLVRSFLRKKLTPHTTLSNIDKLLGDVGKVMSVGKYYTVKIDSEIWSAESENVLQVGDSVKVVKAGGAILKVIKQD